MTERRNPEALHEAAAGWRDMGKHLDGLVRDLDRHVGRAASANWHGPAGEAFAADWHRLKRSVDDSLPAFELAAADLETAAASAQHAENNNGTSDSAAAPPADNSASQSSGRDAAYGFMALGQLASGLGGAFGNRGGKGGQGQRPPVTQEWATSGAAHGPDPFGPPGAGDATTRGGEGIAKGVRTSPPAEAAPAAGDPKGKQEKKGSAAPAASGDKASATSAASGEPKPDAQQHGAFG
ncbi:WXG100 family type VII secretion target [Streptomyces sp. NPDC050636]|uniref:WXG100 family type VII secretion target n=1 Tax=Streptomyces sp. NPDC050636 TaxID=3154510 RepID=UPI00341A7D26